jgi:hypothetical protein
MKHKRKKLDLDTLEKIMPKLTELKKAAWMVIV